MQTTCYVCDHRGFASNAVEVRQDCGAALCREHLDQSRPGRKPAARVRSVLIAYAVYTL